MGGAGGGLSEGNGRVAADALRRTRCRPAWASPPVGRWEGEGGRAHPAPIRGPLYQGDRGRATIPGKCGCQRRPSLPGAETLTRSPLLGPAGTLLSCTLGTASTLPPPPARAAPPCHCHPAGLLALCPRCRLLPVTVNRPLSKDRDRRPFYARRAFPFFTSLLSPLRPLLQHFPPGTALHHGTIPLCQLPAVSLLPNRSSDGLGVADVFLLGGVRVDATVSATSGRCGRCPSRGGPASRGGTSRCRRSGPSRHARSPR